MSQEALEKIKAMNVENIFSNISLWAHAKERDDSFFPSIAVLKSNFTHVQQRNRMQFHVFAALLFCCCVFFSSYHPSNNYIKMHSRLFSIPNALVYQFSSSLQLRCDYRYSIQYLFKIWAHLSKCQSLFDRWKQILLLCRWVNASARALVRIFRQSNLFWLAKCAFSSDEWSKMHNTRFCVYVPP